MKKLALVAATFVAVVTSSAVFAQESPFTIAVDTPMTSTATKTAPSERPRRVVATARKSGVVKGGVAVARAGAPRKPGAYGTLIARYAAAYGVPVGLAHAVVRVESNYRANARGGAGEIGLMQIKPATARMLGYSGKASGLFNPETNLKYGMKYLGQAHRLGGGSVCGTILKYNAGHGAKRMNPVSAAYCAKVKRQLRA
ncbi:MAG: transglycosylase SLT domain-containing protein [Phyllobacteriaceae bacterium]|nr:transglycosylase SLT domain-containing protein [Phyllobacteriaceae bacterium]